MFASAQSGALFLQFFVLGIFLGAGYEICKIFKVVFSNNIFIQNAIKLVYFLAFGFVFCVYLLKYTHGIIHFYLLFACILGVVLEQISVGFFFTKFYQVLYNVFTKVAQKFKSSRFGKRITK